MTNKEDIQKIIDIKKENMNYVINGMCSLKPDENPHNINIPKVVTNKFNDLLYMSRLAVPGIKSVKKNHQPNYKKQVCIYAFNQEELEAYGCQKEKALFEGFEDIEILRFFDLNIPIKMVETSGSSLAVDVLADVVKVEEELIKLEGQSKKMIKTVLWDFDGVILDSMKVRDWGFEEIFKDFDQELIDQLLAFHRANGGLSRYVKIRYFFEEILNRTISEDEVLKYAESFSFLMKRELTNSENLILDALGFIQNNYQHYNFHIVSGSDQKELRFLNKELGIKQYFKSIHGSPTPKTFLVKTLIKENNYNAKNIILIGDSINDFEAASANDISFYGYNNTNLKTVCEVYINSFKEFNLNKL